MRPGLLRSCLFTPADRWKVLKKAWVSNTDCMIIDMEDATAALESVKLQARENVRQFFDEEVATVRKDGREELHPDVVVRVNDPLTTPWGRGDIESIASLSSPPTACLLRKAQNIAEIEAIGRDMPSSIALWVMIFQSVSIQTQVTVR